MLTVIDLSGLIKPTSTELCVRNIFSLITGATQFDRCEYSDLKNIYFYTTSLLNVAVCKLKVLECICSAATKTLVIHRCICVTANRHPLELPPELEPDTVTEKEFYHLKYKVKKVKVRNRKGLKSFCADRF